MTPPDNDLFPGQEGNPANPTPSDSPAPSMATLTTDQIQTALQQATAPLQQQIEEQQRQLQEQTQVIQQLLSQQTPAAPAPSAGSDVDAAYQKLLADPRSFVDERVDERALAVLREKAGPALRTVFEQERDRNLSGEQVAVDRQYGDGFFDEHVRPFVEQAVERYKEYPEATANKEWARTVVWGALGLNLQDPEKYQTMADRRAEAERQRTAPAVVLTDSRQRPARGDALSTDEKEFLQRLDQRSGIQLDPKQYAADRERPATLSAWQKEIQKEAARGSQK